MVSLPQVAKAIHRRQRADLGGSDKAQEDADLEAAIAASLQSTPAVASPRKRPRTTAVGPAEVVDLAADSDDEEECGDDSTAAQIPAHKRAAEASRPEADPNSQALPVPTKPVGTLACQLTAVQVLEKVASAERCTVAELRAYFEECKSQAGREVHGAAECDGELARLRQLAQDIQAAHA